MMGGIYYDIASEAGQSLVLVALLLLGLLAAVGLTVDGGNAYNTQRITQNSADKSAIAGSQYVVTTDVSTKPVLRRIVHQLVEFYAVPSGDGIPDNETNANLDLEATVDYLSTQRTWTILDCTSAKQPTESYQTMTAALFHGLIYTT
jgi:uncharacterized membrane protein